MPIISESNISGSDYGWGRYIFEVRPYYSLMRELATRLKCLIFNNFSSPFFAIKLNQTGSLTHQPAFAAVVVNVL